MDFVGLTARAKIPGSQLNLDERRMIEIGKTLIGKPKAICSMNRAPASTNPKPSNCARCWCRFRNASAPSSCSSIMTPI